MTLAENKRRDNLEERCDAAYLYILEGGTRRQIVLKLMSRFSVSDKTAYADYARAMGTLKTEQISTKDGLTEQIQAIRLVTIQKALKRGQLQTVATLLKDLGAVVGEVPLDHQLAGQQAPTLNISVELPPDTKKPAIAPAEIIEIDPAGA